jgi:hypothetical protein
MRASHIIGQLSLLLASAGKEKSQAPATTARISIPLDEAEKIWKEMANERR